MKMNPKGSNIYGKKEQNSCDPEGVGQNCNSNSINVQSLRDWKIEGIDLKKNE